MPETRKYETNEMVDIDNSGPEVDVTLPEDKKEEVKDEKVVESNEPIIEEVKNCYGHPRSVPYCSMTILIPVPQTQCPSAV